MRRGLEGPTPNCHESAVEDRTRLEPFARAAPGLSPGT